jgi:hypothetical protein
MKNFIKTLIAASILLAAGTSLQAMVREEKPEETREAEQKARQQELQQAPASIRHLPVELQLNILRNMSPQDRENLRRTGRGYSHTNFPN